jgi:DHA2 family methylenomycin A resistance protein-like MFS transporter
VVETSDHGEAGRPTESGPDAAQRTRNVGVLRSRSWLLVVMCVGYFLVLLDVTVVNVALPSVAQDLGTTVPGLQGVATGYAIALALLILPSGAAGDRLGHRSVVLAGLALLAIGSCAGGMAPSTGVLVVARVVQGAGAALLLPGTLAIVADTHPAPAEQARAIATWAAVGSLALPAGPLLGGMLVESAGWRAVFLLNVPIVLVAGLLTMWLAPTASTVETQRSELTKARATFRRPRFIVANVVAGAMNLGSLGLLFLLALFLQMVQGRTAVVAGMALLPLFLPLSLLPPLVGRMVARHGPGGWVAAGLLVAAAGTGLVAGWHEDTGYVRLLPALLMWGCGLGTLTPAVVSAAVSAAPAGRSGLASAVNNAARQAGGALGIAASGAWAGSPARVGHFLAGLHGVALTTAALYVVAALAALHWLRPTSPTAR